MTTACVDCGRTGCLGYDYAEDDQPRCRRCHNRHTNAKPMRGRKRVPLNEYSAHDAARGRMRIVENRSVNRP